MKILLITLFAFSLVFLGIGCGVLVKALIRENANMKRKSNQFFAIGAIMFISYFLLYWLFI